MAPGRILAPGRVDMLPLWVTLSVEEPEFKEGCVEMTASNNKEKHWKPQKELNLPSQMVAVSQTQAHVRQGQLYLDQHRPVQLKTSYRDVTLSGYQEEIRYVFDDI